MSGQIPTKSIWSGFRIHLVWFLPSSRPILIRIPSRGTGFPTERSATQWALRTNAKLSRSLADNQINVVDSRSGVLSLEDSTIREVLYGAHDARTRLLDSHTPFHVTPDIEWFSNYSDGAGDTFQLGNGQQCQIKGIREVPIELLNDDSITLHQVWHVPKLKRSLASIGMLAEAEYRTTLSESWTTN